MAASWPPGRYATGPHASRSTPGALGRFPARVVAPVPAAEVSHCLVVTLTERRSAGLSQAHDDRDRRRGGARARPAPHRCRSPAGRTAGTAHAPRPGQLIPVAHRAVPGLPLAPAAEPARRSCGDRVRSQPVPARAHRAAPPPAGNCEPDTTAQTGATRSVTSPARPPESSRLTVGKPARLQGDGVLPLHRHAADHRDRLITETATVPSLGPPLDVAARMLLTVLYCKVAGFQQRSPSSTSALAKKIA